MIQILLIGRDAPARVGGLGARAGADFEFDTVALPAAGLRQLEASPPDALIIVESGSARRAATLVRAIRERPLGQLIPILVIGPAPDAEVRRAVDAWLTQEQGDAALWRALQDSLGLDVGPSAVGFDDQRTPTAPLTFEPPSSGNPTHSASPAYYIEPIDELPRGGTNPNNTKPNSTNPGGIKPSVPKPHASSPGGPTRTNRPQPPWDTPPADQSPAQAPWNQPQTVDHGSIFPSSGSRMHDLDGAQGGIDGRGIEQKLQAVRHKDYYAILEIRRGSETSVVREAYQRLYQQFDPDEVEFRIAHRFEAELAEIRDALEDAWAVLGDPALREAYLSQALRG